jgi:glutamate formiminotransferase
MVIECVVNVSEGRDQQILSQLSAACAPALLDRHSDPDHHRSVFTLAGTVETVDHAVRALATATVELLDLTDHRGAHPRLGVLDVVPFIPYSLGQTPPTGPADVARVSPLRDAFARWLATDLGVPSFLYGPLPDGGSRTLPDIRRHAFGELSPDFGPVAPDRRAGATAVGARGALVAYNVWVSSPELARRVAPLVRGPQVRALGLAVGPRAQVSCNLIDPARVGPGQLYDAVATQMARLGGAVEGAELVGLVPLAVLKGVPEHRWGELGLSEGATVEARLDRWPS